MSPIRLSHGRPKLRTLTCYATMFAVTLAQASLFGTIAGDTVAESPDELATSFDDVGVLLAPAASFSTA